ncbi:hypothetical protein PV405_34670 [Streptomyces sp. ME02-6979-3A]|uniref:hypothetical protein n=1 Tax=Streptomyces sp. ME02-6979-3A TaxID=3028673 RepID=UPI0029BD1C88|nr:hypothetical protein [Streptomyces sp. ME02-6979-3A]MDX3329737.1 hypothetical protein [Streptomyces sp. ME02-6979-3A]
MTTETPTAVLRNHVADALADADGWEWAPGFDKRRSPSYQEFQRQADAVLAVLPAPALAVACRVLGTTTGQPEAARFCGRADCLASGHRFMLGSAVYTCTGQPTPVTTPWPPVPAERPDHELYVTLRKYGLDPGPAQQMIDTYTQTIRTEQPTPCGPVPDACDAEAGDPCANHEREQAHEEGEHAFCGAKCTTGQPETAPTVTRAEVLREAADRYTTLADRYEAYDREHGDLDEAARIQHDAVRDVAAGLRRLADEAQQPTPAEDESCGRFVPDTPRAPGLCASCGDARGWHSLQAVGEQQPTPAPAEVDGCWCGHPQDRHFTSQSMTLPNGCHDCQGWNGAHAYGQDLPWAATPAPAEETK